MAGAKLNTSSVGRFVTLGGLAGRVGASVVGNQVLELVRSGPARQLRRTENLVRNAGRIAETLGELKGAAMKVGQMLSLHEGLLPPEVAEVLRSLQREAPRVPAEVMEDEIRGSLENFDELFERLDFEAFAAASIGQVHLGVLRDGRPVAVKIKYPLIDEIVKADLANLRRVVHLLVSLVFDLDVEPIWREVRDRLLEELDYTHEAANMRRMAELHRDVPELVIPRVVTEASTRDVLTMELVEGLPPELACSRRASSHCATPGRACCSSSSCAACSSIASSTPTPTSPTSPSWATDG
jgi:predicted unusual protein kinase regulating ubiquinone biosynthesis (AarF/ABC1/UbiB family)